MEEKHYGGARASAGRKPYKDPEQKKVPFNTKIPAWLRSWLTSDDREESAPVMIEKALIKQYGARQETGFTDHDRLLWLMKYGGLPGSDAQGHYWIAYLDDCPEPGYYKGYGDVPACIDAFLNGDVTKSEAPGKSL